MTETVTETDLPQAGLVKMNVLARRRERARRKNRTNGGLMGCQVYKVPAEVEGLLDGYQVTGIWNQSESVLLTI